MALSTVIPVRVLGHEGPRLTMLADLASSSHLPGLVNLVKIQDGQFDLLLDMRLLLRGCKGPLLLLLFASEEGLASL